MSGYDLVFIGVVAFVGVCLVVVQLASRVVWGSGVPDDVLGGMILPLSLVVYVPVVYYIENYVPEKREKRDGKVKT